MERTEVYELIDGELRYQDKRWPGHAHSITQYLVYIRGYVEEALHCATWEAGEGELKTSVRKIASLAVACMEEHGAPPRRPGPDPLDVPTK